MLVLMYARNEIHVGFFLFFFLLCPDRFPLLFLLFFVFIYSFTKILFLLCCGILAALVFLCRLCGGFGLILIIALKRYVYTFWAQTKGGGKESEHIFIYARDRHFLPIPQPLPLPFRILLFSVRR